MLILIKNNNDWIDPDPPTDDGNINVNSYDEKNYHAVTPYTPTNGVNN